MVRESITSLGDTKKADKSWKKLFIAFNSDKLILKLSYICTEISSSKENCSQYSSSSKKYT